jgi:lauroyl/myristoyl acyltransferase
VSAGAGSRIPAWLGRLWGDRPWIYSRGLWALMIALDVLPWPWGEDILARLFALAALAKGSRRRLALGWARQQPGYRAWPLAARVAAFRGRWVARSALLGVRGPEDMRRWTAVVGEERLCAAGGTILLGFHLGPPNVDVALRARGHRIAWMGSRRRSRAWSRAPWRDFADPEHNLTPSDGQAFWAGYLYRARRILLADGSVMLMADARGGRAVFTVSLPGGATRIRPGWLALHRRTGARVLPVLSHLEGRTQVITVHAPLPPLPAEGEDLGEWPAILTALVRDYVRRFPEQCPALVFPPTFRTPGADGTAPGAGPPARG